MLSKVVSILKGDKREEDKKESKERVFVDTCILLFDLLDKEEYKDQCRKFLRSKDHQLMISMTTYFELIHNFMVREICKIHDINSKGKACWLIHNEPGVIPSLKETWKILEYLKKYNLTVLEITNSTIELALKLSKNHELMINDAIHLATCLENGIKRIATSDICYDNVPGIEIWKPSEA